MTVFEMNLGELNALKEFLYVPMLFIREKKRRVLRVCVVIC